MLFELLGGQSTLPVASEHRFHAQVRSQEDTAVGTTVLDHIVARQIPGKRNVSGLHALQCRMRGGLIQVPGAIVSADLSSHGEGRT